MGSATFPHLFMDPLQKLYDLYEDEMRPQLQEPMSPTVSTPQRDDHQHPVIQQRNQVDSHREGGAEVADAHELVHGAVDTADVDSKAKLAATLSRVQDGKDKKGITIEKDAEFQSLLAKDAAVEKNLGQVTPDDLKTPMNQEIPDMNQQDNPESIDRMEEYDYNEDVSYLQKYGRA